MSRLALETRGHLAGPDDVARAIQADTTEPSGQLADSAANLASAALTGENARQQAVDALDRALFEQALARAEGNRSRAAQLLGLNRNTLARRLAELGNDS